MGARTFSCLLLVGLAAVFAPRDARAVVLFHEQFTHPDHTVLKPPTPGVLGVAPVPGPGNTWSSAGGSVTPIETVGGEAILIQTNGVGNGQD